MARIARSGRVAAVLLALLSAAFGSTVVHAQDGPAVPFRPACDLVSEDAIDTILDITVVADEASTDTVCAFTKGRTQLVTVTLVEDQTLPAFRVVLPAAQEATIGRRAAVLSPGDGESTPATAAVALDDGVLIVQVTEVALVPSATAAADAIAAAIAETILAGGPISAVPPSTPGLTALGFEGSLCDLVTKQDLEDVLGQPFKAGPSAADRCSYEGGTSRSLAYVTANFLDAPLAQVRTKGSTAVTVAGRPGAWSAKDGALALDVGGGRLLLLITSVSPQPKGGAARKVEGELEALGERAVARMAPLPPGPSSAPATGICPWLSIESLSAATGITFTRADAQSESTCTYTSSDQRSGVLIGLNDATDLHAAWKDAKGTYHLPDKPTSLQVAGLPAYGGVIDDTSAAVAVDLAGTPDGDGKVLGLLVTGLPPATGDLVALAAHLAEMALAAR